MVTRREVEAGGGADSSVTGAVATGRRNIALVACESISAADRVVSCREPGAAVLSASTPRRLLRWVDVTETLLFVGLVNAAASPPPLDVVP